jgi:hypothetical protein
MRDRERLRTVGWPGVTIYLAIALGTLAVLAFLLKKSSASQLTRGSIVVMLMYFAVAGFMLIASRLLIRRSDDRA